MRKNIVLASGSPRRRELLGGLGWNFRVAPSTVDEVKIEGEAPDALVERLSREKAADVAGKEPGCWVVGADTVVVIDGEVLGKPSNRTGAFNMLSKLAGRSHSVLTGVTLIAPDGRSITGHEETKVLFRELSSAEIEAYIDCGECMDKAGAYAIQEKGTLLVERIEGDYFNVVGLPLVRLSKMFSDMDAGLEEQWRIKDVDK